MRGVDFDHLSKDVVEIFSYAVVCAEADASKHAEDNAASV
jgi:hypothetical protein